MTISDSTALRLARGTLFATFGEHDSAKRAGAIQDIFSPDIIFYEVDGVTVHGHDDLSKQCDKILEGKSGWKFVLTGPVQRIDQLVSYAWSFGPVDGEGQVQSKASGRDIILIEKDQVRTLWLLLDGVSDVKE